VSKCMDFYCSDLKWYAAIKSILLLAFFAFVGALI
jgi:hypothetical protein